MTLKDLEIGKSAVIKTVGGSGALRQHFLDMGVIPGAEVTVVKFAPMGDPVEIRIHGYELTLRLAEADQIEIEEIDHPHTHHAHVPDWEIEKREIDIQALEKKAKDIIQKKMKIRSLRAQSSHMRS